MFNRAKWFKFHSWVGFKLSILICFTLITGTIAVLSHELDWLTNSAMRVDSDTVTELNWSAVYQQAKTQQPDKHFLHIKAPIDPWFAAEVVYYENEDELHRLFLHPTTGEYLGDGRWYNWQRFFRMSHRHLMVPTKIGVTIVGALGFLMLISLLTSFVVYRKWWQGFFRMPRRGHRKVFWADMHRLTGVWSMWFVFILSVTGIWYFVEVNGLRADYPERAKAISEQAQQVKVMPTVEAFDKMLARTKQSYEELTIQIIQFPRKAGGSVVVQGQASAVLVRDRANAVSFDPITAELLMKNRGEDLSVHARISEAADPLHFGTFAGFPSKVVYFVFGVILSVLAVSGTYIYGMRIAKVSKAEARPRRKIWRAAGSQMGWGKWFSYIAIAICMLIAFLLFNGIIVP